MANIGEPGAESADLLISKHVKFLKRCLEVLPCHLTSLDASRLSVAFFAISGLDLLQSIHVLDNERKEIVEWIYSFQVPAEGGESRNGGFRGSTTAAKPSKPISTKKSDELIESLQNLVLFSLKSPLDLGHIAMTYTALTSLLILGDDLSRVDKKAVIQHVRALQLPSGNFCATLEGSESDPRFVYCAACICYILQDWSGMDISKASGFLKSCLSFDGAFGSGPGLEGHGGLTFCSVAALSLMGTLDTTLSKLQVDRLIRWCLFRQGAGFQGRPNKPYDTCYSFWIGATLELLNAQQFLGKDPNRQFLLSTQNSTMGGLAKWPETTPDPLHTYLGLAGLSLQNEPNLEAISPALNITQRAFTHLQSLHSQWKSHPKPVTG